MYNSYGERRVKYVSVPLSALMASVAQAGLIPADAVLVGVTLQEPSDGAISGYEVRLVCEHPDWLVCLAGEQMREATPEATPEAAPTAPEPTEPAAETEPTEAPTEAPPTEETPAAPESVTPAEE